MKLLTAILLAVATLLFAPTLSLAVDPTISAHCRPGAPEVYSRPGGFCEQLARTDSLADSSNRTCPAGYEVNDNPPPDCILIE